MPAKTKKSANGTNSIYQTKDGKYYVGQIVIGKYPNGNCKYKRFKDVKQSVVIQKMKDYQKTFNIVTDATVCYLSDYLTDYIENVKKHTLKPSSYDRTVYSGKTVSDHIGQYMIGQLSSELIQSELINKLKTDGCSFSTIHKCYIILNQCLEYAFDNGKIPSNPCAKVKEPSKKSFVQKKIRWLNDNEIKLFIEQANSTSSRGYKKYKYGKAITLIIYTGLRGGELCALKWSDINFDDSLIYVRGNIVVTTEYGTKKKPVAREQDTTKTADDNNGRVVPLNRQSLAIIQELKEIAEKNGTYEPCNYIATGSTTPTTTNTISYSYKCICEACGIIRPLGIHTLRHTFASLMIRKCVDIKIVSNILGHKDVAFTYNIYVHILDEQKAKAVGLIDLG